MSLLDNAMTECVMMDKTTKPDGYGGKKDAYADGAPFSAAIVFDSSMQARTAQAQGVSSLYTVTTRKNKQLEYHDVFRRLADGKIFRVTSDGDDKYTPETATINMRQVTVEEWEPPAYG